MAVYEGVLENTKSAINWFHVFLQKPQNEETRG